jgi:hypothetical protein
METTESQEQEAKRLQKSDRASGTCGAPLSGVTYALWKSQKEKGAERTFKETITPNTSNLMKYVNTPKKHNKFQVGGIQQDPY